MQKTSPILIHRSPYDFYQTIDRLKKALLEKKMTLFATIDHAKEAKNVSLTLLDEQVFIFGDPKTGTFLMQENPEIGIEFPLKILVWQNSEHITQMGYKEPLLLADLYAIKKNIEILKKMSQGLAQLILQVVSEK